MLTHPKTDEVYDARQQRIVYKDIESVRDCLLSIVDEMLPAGSTTSKGELAEKLKKPYALDETVYFQFERGCAVTATISVQQTTERVPLRARKRLVLHRFSVSIGWSSSSRTLDQAVAAIKLYEEATAFAAVLSHLLSGSVGEVKLAIEDKD